MANVLRMNATLHPRGPAGAFLLTDEQVSTIGDGKSVFPVLVTVNGASHQLRLARMGGENMIGMSKAARCAAGVEIGQKYSIEIAHDQAVRTIEVPADFLAALKTGNVVPAFDALAPSHRKEYVRWITEAKREATRTDRISKAVAMIRDGTPRS